MKIGIAWTELVAGARGRGRAAVSLYVVHTKPSGDAAAIEAELGGHLKYQSEIEASGAMFAAGPLGDFDGVSWMGEGLIIVRAGSLDEARRIAEADPMHKSGARTFTVQPWALCEGSINIRVHCSDRSMEIS